MASSDKPRAEGHTFKCSTCGHTITTPCWFCADCRSEDGSKFICDFCEMMIDKLDPWDFTDRYRREVTQIPVRTMCFTCLFVFLPRLNRMGTIFESPIIIAKWELFENSPLTHRADKQPDKTFGSHRG
ncbi:hypothetical protein B0H19DRAFT_1171948 [Mycena capillaripes]|nr:hypothetical protein B0H19DRAFT_1171948 [Mycena capillaripes]